MIVAFEVYNGELEAEEEASWLETVGETFTTVMATITDFMGTPVVGAVASGSEVPTPASVAAKASGSSDEGLVDFGVYGGGEDEEIVEPDVITEIRHTITATQTDDASQQPEGTVTYGMLLGAFVGVLAAVLIGICLYNKFCSPTRDKVVKEVTDASPLEKVRAATGRLESQSIEQQYRPENTDEGDFGGVSFDNRNVSLVGLKARNAHMHNTADKFMSSHADSHLGDDEQEKGYKLKDFDSGMFTSENNLFMRASQSSESPPMDSPPAVDLQRQAVTAKTRKVAATEEF